MPFVPSKLAEAIDEIKSYKAEFAKLLTKNSIYGNLYTSQHIYNWLTAGKSPSEKSMDDIVRVTKKTRDYFYSHK